MLQIFEKREDSFYSEVLTRELGYLPVGGLDQMPKKKSESIPVTGDGVGVAFSSAARWRVKKAVTSSARRMRGSVIVTPP